MKDDDFCKLFLYTIISVICFFLNIVFMASLYNIRSQAKLLNIYEFESFVSYKNSYTAIAVLFSFGLLAFFAFVAVLLLLMIKTTEKIKNVGENKDNQPIEPVAIESSEERINRLPNKEPENDEDKEEKLKIKILMFLSLFFQVLFLGEVIILSVYHSTATNLAKDLKEINIDGKYFTKIYRNLIVVGYIFFVFYILLDLYILILVGDCGKRRNTNNNNNTNNTNANSNENKNLERFEENRYCECFSDCIINCCQKMENKFSEWEKNDERSKQNFTQQLQKMDENIKELEKYRDDLVNLNRKILGKKPVGKEELENLNLPTCIETMETKTVKIAPKKK